MAFYDEFGEGSSVGSIYEYFTAWFKQKVYDAEPTEEVIILRCLSQGPL